MTMTYIVTLVVVISAKATSRYDCHFEPGQQVAFHREWGDYADPDAVSVWTCSAPHAQLLGYLAGKEAEIVADLIEDGRDPVGEVLDVEVPESREASTTYRLKVGLTLRRFSGTVP